MHLVTRRAGVLSAVRFTTGGFQRKHLASGVPVMRAGLAREQRVRGSAAADARVGSKEAGPRAVQSSARACEGSSPQEQSPGTSGVLVAGSRQVCTEAAGKRRQTLG